MRDLLRGLIVAASACTPTWHRAALATEGVAVGMLACDGGTTQQFLDAHARLESNPVLGPEPSAPRLWGYLGAIAVAVVATNQIVPPKWAVALNSLVIGAEGYSVQHNISIGSSVWCGAGPGGPWTKD